MVRRRATLLSTSAGLASMLGLPGCAAPGGEGSAPPLAAGELARWRVLQGGYLAATPMAVPRPGIGPAAPPAPAAALSRMFVRWSTPTAIALRGQELLVADLARQALWRTEVGSQQISAVTGAPVHAGVSMQLGPDLSAWLLDPPARQVLRFARDGRLLQTLRLPAELASPSALLLADNGATVLVADGLGARWGELRGTLLRGVAPADGTGKRIGAVDALATAGPDALFVLDRLAAAVHVVNRDGRLVQTLGRGELLQPRALASDGRGRAYVLDAQDGRLCRLRSGAPPWRWTPAALGLRRIDALAADGSLLALADGLAGEVVLFSTAHDLSA